LVAWLKHKNSTKRLSLLRDCSKNLVELASSLQMGYF
jgi:hypothetical protein